jgi:hypothetical protein
MIIRVEPEKLFLLRGLFENFIKMESSEETPLLASDRDVDREEVYKRFAPARKTGILAIVSVTGLIPRTCISS